MKKIFLPLFFIVTLNSCTQEIEEMNLANESMTSVTKVDDGKWIPLNNGAYAKKTSEGYVMEGDMILSDMQIEALTDPTSRSGFLSDINKRWPNGKVYYTVADDFAKVDELNQAIEHYNQYTHIRFVPKNSSSNNYVEFINHPTSTDSYVGMIGGKQNIRVASWADDSSIAHEMGHAIGLIHEHSRYDRDDYIVVHWDNIKDDKEYNFAKMTSANSGISNVTTDYDYQSLMHYSSFTASEDFVYDTSLPIMTKTNGDYLWPTYVLSKEDIISINNLYPVNLEITGNKYLLLPDCLTSYRIWANVPELATIQWSIHPANSGSIISGQGSESIETRITSDEIQYVQAVITYPKTGQVFTERFDVHASYAPIVTDIEMFKYWQGDGGYTLRAISTDEQAVCSWSHEGGEAEFTDLTFPDDASFLGLTNLFKEIYFYTPGMYGITVNASNSYGSSSFTKSGLYIYDTVSSSGFVLSPNPVVNTTEVNLTIVDKARSLADEYIISVYKDNQLVLYFESQELQNKLNVNSFEDGEYLVVLEKNGVKSEQKLLIKKNN